MATVGVGVLMALVIGTVVAIAPDVRFSGGQVSEAEPVQASSTMSVAEASSSAAPAPAAPAPAPRPTTLEPRIPAGRTELGDGIFAERSGAEVTVNFDTELLRTRFDWKFEGVVRATLPAVFGPPAREALDSVPTGKLVNGNLLGPVLTRGIRVELDDSGHAILVTPVARPGLEGPLVVSYRARSIRE